MKKKTIGIILAVLGIMAFLGSIVNGSFATFFKELSLPNLVTIVLMFGMIISGIILIIKGKNE